MTDKVVMVPVADELIRECKTFTEALRLCLAVSGRSKTLGEVAWDCGWRDGGKQLSRILNIHANPEDRRHMDMDKVVPFMVACRNTVPLRWLAMQLEPQVAEVRTDRDDWRQEMATLQAVLQEVAEEVRGLKHGRGGTQFSLVQEGVPVWLLEAVDEAAVMLKSGGP